jgi:REP element-mobilizing transposase RayT
MPRQQRVRLAGVPQHVIQRGNNRQATFFDNSDYRRYLECLSEALERSHCALQEKRGQTQFSDQDAMREKRDSPDVRQAC